MPYDISIEHGANGLCRANLTYFDAWNGIHGITSDWADCQDWAIDSVIDEFKTETRAVIDSEFSDSFMKPQICTGADLQGVVPDAEPDSFYCRLSAPGYMDCTELEGPFRTEWEAACDLILNYGTD